MLNTQNDMPTIMPKACPLHESLKVLEKGILQYIVDEDFSVKFIEGVDITLSNKKLKERKTILYDTFGLGYEREPE